MHDRTQIDGGDLDRHITQYPEAGRYSDSIGDAECAVHDANKRWLRDHRANIKTLFDSWRSAIEEVWADNTTADLDDEFIPMAAIAELMEDADNEVKHHEYTKRQGRNLGGLE